MIGLLGKIQDENLAGWFAERDCRSSPIFGLSLHRISRRRKDDFTAVHVVLLVFSCLEIDFRHDDRIIAQQKPINARKKSIANFAAIDKKQEAKQEEPLGTNRKG